MKRIVLSGYYGFANCGDEAILAAILDQLALRDLEITVLSARPALTTKLYSVPAIKRTDPIAVGRALMQADLFVQGGGSLIQDATSWRSPLFYLGQLMQSGIVGTPFMVLGQGIGPLNRGWLHYLTRETLVHAKAIALRDVASYAWALQNLPTDLPTILTADPVYLLQPAPVARLEELAFDLGLDDLPRPWTLVAIKGDPSNKREVHAWVEALNGYSLDIGGSLILCPFFPAMDAQFYAAIQPQLTGPRLMLPPTLLPREVLGLIGQTILVIAGRLHPLIMAANQRIPFAAISYDPKMGAAAREFEVEPVAQRPLIGGRALLDALGEAAEDPGWPQRYDGALPILEKRALLNFQVLDRVLDGQLGGSELVLD